MRMKIICYLCLGFLFCFYNEMRCRGILILIKMYSYFFLTNLAEKHSVKQIRIQWFWPFRSPIFRESGLIWRSLWMSCLHLLHAFLAEIPKYDHIQFHLRINPHILYLWTTFMFSSYLSAVRTKRKITLERGGVLESDAISLHIQLCSSTV